MKRDPRAGRSKLTEDFQKFLDFVPVVEKWLVLIGSRILICLPLFGSIRGWDKPPGFVDSWPWTDHVFVADPLVKICQTHKMRQKIKLELFSYLDTCFQQVSAFYRNNKLIDNARIQSVLVRIDSNWSMIYLTVKFEMEIVCKNRKIIIKKWAILEEFLVIFWFWSTLWLGNEYYELVTFKRLHRCWWPMLVTS